MLSKKMTFSLMSLITLLAFAFMAPSAMAAFGVTTLSASDVNFVGETQIEAVGGTATVTIYLTVDHVVTLSSVQTAFAYATAGSPGTPGNALDKSVVDILNYHGAIIDTTGNSITVTRREVDPFAEDPNRRDDGKNYTIVIAAVPRPAAGGALDMNAHAAKIRVYLPAGAIAAADPASTEKSIVANVTFELVDSEPTPTDPMPVSIALAPGVLIPDAGFVGDSFNVIVTLSEQPKENKFPKALLAVVNGAASDGVYLGAIDPIDGPADADTAPDAATGRDRDHHQYLVTITPTVGAGAVDLMIKLNEFGDDERFMYTGGNPTAPGPNEWTPDFSDFDRVEGADVLTVAINKPAATVDLTEGTVLRVAKDIVIPGGGYLIATGTPLDQAIIPAAGIVVPPENGKAPLAHQRKPAQLEYNVVGGFGLPNLEGFLNNGGTIDVESPHPLVITEIMWGSDASLPNPTHSQWIELYNTGAAYTTVDDDGATDANEAVTLVFYGPNETPPALNADGTLPAGVTDRVGTIGDGGYWSPAGTGKGQGGRTGVGEKAADLTAVIPTQALASMYRVIDAAGVAADGEMASSWAQSVAPSLNFNPQIVGTRIGTPGAAAVQYPVAPTPDPVVTPDPVATAADIMISEIMVDTGGGRLPQWIELSNVSGKKVSLAGWSVLISNSAADADAVGSSVSINLSGSLDVSAHTGNTGKGQSLLLVAWGARSSSSINADLVMNVSGQVGETGRYTLISEMGFMIGLVPPQTSGILTYGDAAGNLDEGWELPVSDGGRSSLIRREADALGTATLGTMANGWVLASDTALVSGPATWYGSDEDAGTPGYDAGGPLPVSLSHFRPARDDAGAVVITWSTQSELNNAGFFIKRSQQRDGQFKVINAAMVQGAGTTSEKQFYTYTDTTAQPNVVYYYQIEDVSLDGNRQTLTNGIRLKGHIGAVGKLTTTWGDLKTSQ